MASKSLLSPAEILFSGVLNHVSDTLDKKRVILAINLALTQILLYLVLYFYATLKGYNSATTYYALIAAGMISLMLVLTNLGYYKYGMIFGLIITSVSNIFIVQRVGADSGVDHYYVLFGLIPFVFFGYKDRLLAVGLTLFTFACFLVAKAFELSFIEPMNLTAEQSKVFLLVNSVLTFLLTLYVMLKLLEITHMAEKALLQKQFLTEEQNKELRRVNLELDKFVYSASHDLSAPLKSIGGLIQITKMEDPPSHVNQYLDMMQKSVVKLESFIKDIINYSRNSRMPIRNEKIDFSGLVKSVWEDHLYYAKQQSKIEFMVEENLATPIYSDQTRLRIIFNNLLSNAIKFHVEDLRTRPYVRVAASESTDHYIFETSDNGIGIDPTIKEDIFTMFFRGSVTVAGSGLGLYILKESVEKLNGIVSVESEEGVGTTFKITIPKSQN